MQLQKINSDGTFNSISVMEEASPPRTKQSYIDEAISVSEEEPGFHVICGDDLDSELPEDATARIVTSKGILLFCNLPDLR